MNLCSRKPATGGFPSDEDAERWRPADEGSGTASARTATPVGGVGASELPAVAKFVLEDECDDAGRLFRLMPEPLCRDGSCRATWAAGKKSTGEVGEYRRPPPVGVEAAEGTRVTRSSSNSTYNYRE